MKKNLLLVSILAAAISCAACDDKDTESHNEGAVRCNINSAGVDFSETWTNGAWKVRETCGVGNHCVNGECLPTDNACTSDVKPTCIQLDGDRSVETSSGITVTQSSGLKYCANNEFHVTNCRLQNGQVCITDATGAHCGDDPVTQEEKNADCSNGDVRCDLSGVRQQCVNGKWSNDPCANNMSCSAGKCVKPSTACAEGEVRCDGKVPYTCHDYKWDAGEACAEACSAGKCVPKDYIPSEGEACGSFDSACKNDVYSFCSNSTNTVVTDSCSASDGKECADLADGTSTCSYQASVLGQFRGALASECSYSNQIVLAEPYSRYEGAMILLRCVDGADGKLHVVDELAFNACDGDGKTMFYLENGNIFTVPCSEKCVSYPNRNSAQCEVAGAKENVKVDYCSANGLSCGSAGVSSVTNKLDEASSIKLCSDEYQKKAKQQFGEDYACIEKGDELVAIQTCKLTTPSETACSASIVKGDNGYNTIASIVKSECVKISGDINLLLATEETLCNNPVPECGSDYKASCDGDSLVFCVGGNILEEDCAEKGQKCDPDALKCVAPSVDPEPVVTVCTGKEKDEYVCDGTGYVVCGTDGAIAETHDCSANEDGKACVDSWLDSKACGCASDTDCADGSVCNTETGKCGKKSAIDDNACLETTGTNYVCSNAILVACQDGAVVAADSTDCSTRKDIGNACVVSDDARCGCATDNDCVGMANGSICDLDQHSCGCKVDTDCPSGKTCNTNWKMCS